MKITKEQLDKLMEKPELLEKLIKAVFMWGDADLNNSDEVDELNYHLSQRISEAEQALTLKLKLKPVDMSIFIDSPIDCVFWNGDKEPENDEGRVIGMPFDDCSTIRKDMTVNGSYWVHGFGTDFTYCKPRMDYWFSVNLFSTTGACEGVICKLERAGFEVDADYFNGYLRAFKITGLCEGYCWPWECKDEN